MYVLPFVELSFFFFLSLFIALWYEEYSMYSHFVPNVWTRVLWQRKYSRRVQTGGRLGDGMQKEKRNRKEKQKRREPEASTVPLEIPTWHFGRDFSAEGRLALIRNKNKLGVWQVSLLFFLFFFHFQPTVCTTEPKKAEDMKIYKLSAGDGWCLQVQSVCYHHGVGRTHPRTGALSLGFLSYMLQKKKIQQNNKQKTTRHVFFVRTKLRRQS